MASPWKLPQELIDQIIQACFDRLWRNLPETEKVPDNEILDFLALRRICREYFMDLICPILKVSINVWLSV